MMSLVANITLSPSGDIHSSTGSNYQADPKKADSKSSQAAKNTSPAPSKSNGALVAVKVQQPSPPQEPEELDLMTQIGAFFKSLIFSEPSPSIPPSIPIHQEDNWQANYLSPVHTKLKKEGKVPTPEKEKDVEWLLKHHFKGILPYFRVWEIKMEEMDADVPTIGRGTPAFPNRPIFKREMVATKLFLKDYGKRRGLTNHSSNINEEAVDVKSLRKNSVDKPSFSALRTQSLAPEQVIKRRKNINNQHRPSSKLIS